MIYRDDHVLEIRTEREYFAEPEEEKYLKSLKEHFLRQENNPVYNYSKISFSYKEKSDYLRFAVHVDTKDLRAETIHEGLLDYLGGLSVFKRGKFSFERKKEELIRIGLKQMN